MSTKLDVVPVSSNNNKHPFRTHKNSSCRATKKLMNLVKFVTMHLFQISIKTKWLARYVYSVCRMLTRKYLKRVGDICGLILHVEDASHAKHFHHKKVKIQCDYAGNVFLTHTNCDRTNQKLLQDPNSWGWESVHLQRKRFIPNKLNTSVPLQKGVFLG